MDFNKIVGKLKEIDPSDIFNAHGTSASEKTNITTAPKTMLKENDQLAILAGIKSEKQVITESVAVSESAPKGWEGTVKSMKKHKEIDNPWALSHWMKGKGYKSHKNEGRVSELEEDDGSTKYGVFMKGGSVGTDNSKPAKVFDSGEEAKQYAARLNKNLSPTERKYYNIKYFVRPVKNEGLDTIISREQAYALTDKLRTGELTFEQFKEAFHNDMFSSITEAWDDDDEDPDVAKADSELKKKGIKLPTTKADPDKDMSKLAKKSKKDDDLDESKKVGKKAKKDYDGDGKIESEKDEVWGSRMKAAEKNKKVSESWDDDDDWQDNSEVKDAEDELKKRGIKLPKVKHKEVPIKKTSKDREEEVNEAYDDEDPDVAKADSELKKKGIKLPKVKVDPDKDMSKLAKKSKKDDDLDEAKMCSSKKKSKVKESMTFIEAVSIVKENIGSAQLDALDEKLWTWAKRVAASKVEEGVKSQAMAIKIYENFGGNWGVYLHESKK